MTFVQKIVRVSAAISVMALCETAVPAKAQHAQVLKSAQIEKVKKDASAAVQKYYQFFRDQNMKALPEQSFHIPWILLTAKGPQNNLTKEQALEGFEGSLKGLLANGWGKSIFTIEGVCVLSESAAIVSGYNTRYKKDDSVMSVGGVAYILSKGGDGWKIASYSGTTKGKVVRCD